MKKEDLRIVFMGTPEFAVETLRTLVENDYNVVAVVTQPDKPVGRHRSVLQASAVKLYAVEHGLPVLQPEKMKDSTFLEDLRSYHANLQVVVAFRMLPEVVWAMPEYGTFNVHAALLPQYRGAAPINWAIINGETETGVTTFFLDHDIDTGRIIMKKSFAIPDDADVQYVYDGLMRLGAQICMETLDTIIATNGHPTTIAQEDIANSQLNHAPKIFKETCEIRWEKTAKQIYDFVRGLSPYPGAWTTLVAPDCREMVLKVYRTRKTEKVGQGCGVIRVEGKRLYVSAADKMLEIVDLQLAGKKRMTANDFMNGMKQIEELRMK
ncbi:MAG: methionyl-tRNA formyltransferase [Prevotella sp.]|nr:methionyl-tRNA formyltransferase [Prevotella sp.]